MKPEVILYKNARLYAFLLHIFCCQLAFLYLSPYKNKENKFLPAFAPPPHKKQNPQRRPFWPRNCQFASFIFSLNVRFSFLSKLIRQTETAFVSLDLCILSSEPSYQYQKNRCQRSEFCWVFSPFFSVSPLYLLLSFDLKVMFFVQTSPAVRCSAKEFRNGRNESDYHPDDWMTIWVTRVLNFETLDTFRFLN